MVYLAAGAVGFGLGCLGTSLAFLRLYRQRTPAPTQGFDANALSASEARFALAIKSAPLPVMLFAGDGEIMATSDAWHDCTGFSRNELSNLNEWQEQAHIKTDHGLLNSFLIWSEGATTRSDRRLRFATKQGENATLEMHCTELGELPDRRKLIIAMGIDMTEQLEAVERLTSALEEVQDFAYLTSHDLQEPLRSIAGYTQLLERRYAEQLDDRARNYVERVVAATGRMQNLLNDLLAYSRLTSKARPPEDCDTNKIVQAALDNLHAAVQDSGAEIHVGNLLAVRCDRVQLVQLFQNLLANAIKFRDSSAPHIEVFAAEEVASRHIPRGYCTICVRDRGIGIDPAMQERIFVIFQRLHGRTEYPGTGIGLAVCRKIIDRHGGDIWVESKPGEGAAFYFTLPRASRS